MEHERKAKKLEDIEKLILEIDEEFASKLVAIRKLSLEIASKEKTLEIARDFTQRLSEKRHKEEERLGKCTTEYLRKKDELRSVQDNLGECLQNLDIKERELNSLESLFTEINRQVEEGKKRMVRLNNSNEQLSRTIQVKHEELCSINKAIRERSGEYEIKRNDLVQVQSSITNLTDELTSKQLELESVKKNITDGLSVFQSVKEKQISLEASLIKREKEFEMKEKELAALGERIDNKDQQLKSMEQESAKCVEDYEQKLAKCEKEFGLKEKELAALVERIENKNQQVKSMEQKFAKFEKEFELKEKELAALGERFDTKGQQLKSMEEKLLKSVEVYGKKLASSAQEGALKDLDGSDSFSPNEVLIGLQIMGDPGRYVLNRFSEQLIGALQRREKCLGDHMLKVLIPMFEELPRVVRPSEHLRSEARKLAEQWRLMVGNTGQMSPLEAWGFLQFIVAYGLLDPTKQNETLQFASNVAHFRKAPKLFQSLGLGHAIPSFIDGLVNERKIITAIRFMLHFNLNYIVNLLTKEIISLQSSTTSRFELHVEGRDSRRLRAITERRDAGKLRDIIEIIEDFKLSLNLLVDLIVKFMVPRGTQNQNQKHFAVISSVSCPIPTIFGLELSQASQSTTGKAQSFHQFGHKRLRLVKSPRHGG